MGSCDFRKVLVSACSVYPTQSHDIGPRVKALRAEGSGHISTIPGLVPNQELF